MNSHELLRRRSCCCAPPSLSPCSNGTPNDAHGPPSLRCRFPMSSRLPMRSRLNSGSRLSETTYQNNNDLITTGTTPGGVHPIFVYHMPRTQHDTGGAYSIGKWLDTDGDGRYDMLEVETRGFKGPRVYDAS